MKRGLLILALGVVGAVAVYCCVYFCCEDCLADFKIDEYLSKLNSK